MEDYQILRGLLLRASGYVQKDIKKEPDYHNDPDFLGGGLSLNEYRWYREYDDERKYATDFKRRASFISNTSQYIQRREMTNLDKFQVTPDEEHLRRMTLIYSIQLFDDFGDMVFAAILYKSAKEHHILVHQWFVGTSKRLSVCDVIPEDAVLKTNTIVYGCDYPRFSVISKTERLNI